MTAIQYSAQGLGAVLAETGKLPEIDHLKPPVDPSTISWRNLRRDAFWQRIPAWKDVDEATFLNHKWQEKNAVTSTKKLIKYVQDLVTSEFVADVSAGFARAPMAVRISPYLLGLIDWDNPYEDPIRRQFLPVGSQLEPDHSVRLVGSRRQHDDGNRR